MLLRILCYSYSSRRGSPHEWLCELPGGCQSTPADAGAAYNYNPRRRVVRRFSGLDVGLTRLKVALQFFAALLRLPFAGINAALVDET